MDFPAAIPPWFAAAAAAAIILSISFYAQFLRVLWRKGGNVRVDEFGIPDLFVISVFIVWFGAVIAGGFGGGNHRAITIRDLIRGGAAFCGIVGLLAAFLRWRGIRLRAQFGVECVAWWKVPLFALGLFICAMPVVMAAGAAIQLTQSGPVERQPLVEFFSECARIGDHRAMLAIVIAGGVIAPITEELLFRGYLYGVFKKYSGWAVALIANSLLFASIHLNAASLFPLFIFASILTIAYEITGSILVNIGMHALFNLTMLFMLWRQVQSGA